MKKHREILRILEKKYPVERYREDPFRVLIGVILSHRTTDKISWPTTDRLFNLARTPKEFGELKLSMIKKTIRPVNYYITKAKRIKAVSKMLVEKFGGRVPNTREELMELPGVGGKSADIVLSYGFGKPVVAVDTHVAAISKRLGWTKEKAPEKIRKDLHHLFNKNDRMKLNSILVDFGKEICVSPKPKCYMCPVEKYCPYEHKNLDQKK